MKFLPLLMMAFGAMVIGCERHDFEDTRRLHDKDSAKPVEHAEDTGTAAED